MTPSRAKRSRIRLVERVAYHGVKPDDIDRWDDLNRRTGLSESLMDHIDDREAEEVMLLCL